MRAKETTIERYIAKDIAYSFWPFLPERILMAGEKALIFANALGDEMSNTRIDIAEINDRNTPTFNERVLFLNKKMSSVSATASYRFALLIDNLLCLPKLQREMILSVCNGALERDGLVMAVEHAGHDTLQFDLLQEEARSLGFYDSFLSPVEGTKWKVAMFRKSKHSE